MNKFLMLAGGIFISPTIFTQVNWQKGGNNATPPFSPPTLGTNYNSQLQFVTNSIVRARLKLLPMMFPDISGSV